MITLIIAVFLVLLFLVAIVLSVKTWRAGQVIAVILIFLASIFLVISASLSFKTHATWKKKYVDTEKLLKDADVAGDQLAYGDAKEVPWGTGSVADLQQRLNQLLIDQGRVWRHCPPSAPSGDTITISTVPPNTPPEEAQPSGIHDGTVLFAFKEHPVTGYPMIYLGEFRVAKLEDPEGKSITLKPTGLFDQENIAEPNSTWALYEIMPLDRHDAFADEPRTKPLLDDQALPLFGQMIGQQPAEQQPAEQQPGGQQPDEQQMVDQLKEQQSKDPFSAVAFQAQNISISDLSSDFQKDGRPATEQDVSQFPENVWLKLEFEKEYTTRVDSNSPDAGLTGVYFDAEGYAVSAALRQGSDVTFEVSDIGVFPYGNDEDRKFVDGLISSGVCRNLGPFYVRNLRDYEEAFHDFRDRWMKCKEATDRAKRDIQALDTAIASTKAQTAYRQGERTGLQGDLERFSLDRQQIAKLVGTLDDQKVALQEELRNLFQTNLALNQQLANIDQKLTDEINRRTAAAAAQVQ